jgi:hypothetical protein
MMHDFYDNAFAPAVTAEPWEIPELRHGSIARHKRASDASRDSKETSELGPRLGRDRGVRTAPAARGLDRQSATAVQPLD